MARQREASRSDGRPPGGTAAGQSIGRTTGIPTVVLRGEIDVFTAATACRALDAIDGRAVVDLSEVRLLSAAGLTELARLARRVGYRKVVLAGANRDLRRVLEIARFELLFTIEEPAGRM